MFPDDKEPWKVLFNNFFEVGGCIYKKDPDHYSTDLELEAIRYMCEEWDYSFYPGDIN